MQLTENRSKIYKFKIADVKINVIVDDYYTINLPEKKIDFNWAQDNLHYHAIHEMFFVNDSTLTVFTNDKTYEYNNCIVCIPPFFKHRTYGKNVHKIFFSVGGYEKASSDFLSFINNLISNELPFELSPDSSVDFLINQMELLLDNNSSINTEMISSLFKLIFCYLYNFNHKNTDNVIYKGNESYLIKIDAIINNYQYDINLKTVANELCLSTKQTSRIIKKHFKKSLSDLVTEKRLEVASNMLRYSDKSISQIVEHINFTSETYFYHQFKKYYNCTPTEYKNQKNADWKVRIFYFVIAVAVITVDSVLLYEISTVSPML